MAKKRYIGLGISLMLLIGQRAYSQGSVEVKDQLWLGYFNQSRFTQRSGLWADFQFRFTNHFVYAKSQDIIRFGYTYYLKDDIRLTAGYGYVTTFGQSGKPNISEHQPWEQIQWKVMMKSLVVRQWVRVEERFRQNTTAGEISGGYTFGWRFRYAIGFNVPLKGKVIKPKSLFLAFNEEIFINAGDISSNHFDQNRLAGGFGYQVSRSTNIQLSYMNEFQQVSNTTDYVSINSIRVFVIQNLDFRRSDRN